MTPVAGSAATPLSLGATAAASQVARANQVQTLYELGGAAVLLEGESLLPFLTPHSSLMRQPPSTQLANADQGRRRKYALSELKEWMVLNRPEDKQLPGALPRRLVGYGWQLYVRTAQYAYIAYFRPQCLIACVPPYHRLLDEALFDRSTDPGETRNLAYNRSHARTRWELLQIAVREWNISVSGPMTLSRGERVKWLDEHAKVTVTKEPTSSKVVKPDKASNVQKAWHTAPGARSAGGAVAKGKGGGRGGNKRRLLKRIRRLSA